MVTRAFKKKFPFSSVADSEHFPPPYYLYIRTRDNCIVVRRTIGKILWGAKIGIFQSAQEIYDFLDRTMPDVNQAEIQYIRHRKDGDKRTLEARQRAWRNGIGRLFSQKGENHPAHKQKNTLIGKRNRWESRKGSTRATDETGKPRYLRAGQELPEGWVMGWPPSRRRLNLKKIKWQEDLRNQRHGRVDDMRERETTPE
jgi:hypothetical protein